MAAPRAPAERLKILRADIARDAADLRRRMRDLRSRLPHQWQEVHTLGRDLLEVLWVLLRRRGPEGGPPPPPASPR